MDEVGFEIIPITQDDLPKVLEVYRQCEDFLALGPVAQASLGMVKQDIALSQAQGGIFCGIYNSAGEMMGVLDYIPAGFEGDPGRAFLELLMIARPFRNSGLGARVVAWLVAELRKNPELKILRSGVQANNLAGMRFWQRCGFTITGGPAVMPDTTIAFQIEKPLA